MLNTSHYPAALANVQRSVLPWETHTSEAIAGFLKPPGSGDGVTIGMVFQGTVGLA